MTHTPGPWEATQEREFYQDHVQPYSIRTVRDDEEDIVYIARCMDSWDTDMRANARLIAASPDLLEACKAAVAALTQPKTYPADIQAATKWLSAAIAKAEGSES